MSIQEALDYEQTPLLGRVFGTEILGRLPRTGHDLTRKTALSLIGVSALITIIQALSYRPR